MDFGRGERIEGAREQMAPYRLTRSAALIPLEPLRLDFLLAIRPALPFQSVSFEEMSIQHLAIVFVRNSESLSEL